MSAVETALRSKGSLAWAYAMMISLSATLFALQTSEVRAQTFDFSFSGTDGTFGYDNGFITGGVITVSGPVITSISGNASGLSSIGLNNGPFSFSGTIDSSSSYSYNNSSDFMFGVYINNIAQNDFTIANGTFYVSYVADMNNSFVGTSVATLRSVAVPEIDGSVVPRAAFVMMGLFWIFKSRRRRLRLAEA